MRTKSWSPVASFSNSLRSHHQQATLSPTQPTSNRRARHVSATLATVLAVSTLTATPVTANQSAFNLTSTAATSSATRAEASVNANKKPCSIGLEGVNIIGRDVGSARDANKYEGCRAHCVANDQCKWYTWTNLEGGTCWLKSGDTTQIEVNGQGDGAYSVFVRYVDVCPKVAFVLKDMDLGGGDIGDTPGAGIEACYDICINWPDCQKYSWSKADKGPTCWLKNGSTKSLGASPGVSAAYMLQSYN